MSENYRAKNRYLILKLIRAEPGIHLGEVPRRTDLSLGTVRYHLRRLEEEGLVVSHRYCGFRRLFPGSGLPREDQVLLAALRTVSERAILLALLAGPRTFTQLERSTGLAPATLSVRLRSLQATGLVTRELGSPSPRFLLPGRQRVLNLSTRGPSTIGERMAGAALEIFEA